MARHDPYLAQTSAGLAHFINARTGSASLATPCRPVSSPLPLFPPKRHLFSIHRTDSSEPGRPKVIGLQLPPSCGLIDFAIGPPYISAGRLFTYPFFLIRGRCESESNESGSTYVSTVMGHAATRRPSKYVLIPFFGSGANQRVVSRAAHKFFRYLGAPQLASRVNMYLSPFRGLMEDGDIEV